MNENHFEKNLDVVANVCVKTECVRRVIASGVKCVLVLNWQGACLKMEKSINVSLLLQSAVCYCKDIVDLGEFFF